MAVIFDGSSTKYGSLPNLSYFNNGVAFTYAVWFKPAGGSLQQFIFGEDQSAGGSTRYSGTFFRGNSSGQVSFAKSAIEAHYDAGTPSAGSFNVHVFSRPANASAAVSAQALNATDTAPSTLINGSGDLQRLIIGARRVAGGSTYTDFFNGSVAVWAIWNRQLTSVEIDTIQGGAHPNTIASGLVDWQEITGTGTATTKTTNAGTVMTFVGSPQLNNETPFSPYVISSLNSGTNVLNAGAVNTAPVTGYAPTSGTVGNLTLTSVSTTTGVTTFTIPWFTEGEIYPLFGVNQTLTLNEGANSAQYVAPFNARATDTVTTVSAPDNIDPYKLGYHLDLAGFPPANGDLLISTTSELITYPDTSTSEPVIPVTTVVTHRVSSTGRTYMYTVTASAGGIVVVDAGLTVRGLSVSGLGVSGLTVRGLGGAAAMAGGFPYLLPFLLS